MCVVIGNSVNRYRYADLLNAREMMGADGIQMDLSEVLPMPCPSLASTPRGLTTDHQRWLSALVLADAGSASRAHDTGHHRAEGQFQSQRDRNEVDFASEPRDIASRELRCAAVLVRFPPWARAFLQSSKFLS